MEAILGIMIPLVALMIPLTVVVGKMIIGPIVSALNRIADQRPQDAELAARVKELEYRLEAFEKSARPALEELEFRRSLKEGRSDE